ncbi:hypothetical protein [Paracoccus litorisediminis]|uniref:hypothetical protein n=1 Tax=Paracoccus litorisediminis TaxID=2006130 RepID=UPI0037363F3E
MVAGTGGTIGSTVAVLTAPATIAAAGATAMVVGGLEGVCYFSDDRITDYAEVDAIMRDIAKTAPRHLFQHLGNIDGEGTKILIKKADAASSFDTYRVKDLYIVNGVLMHRKRGWNTEIGLIGSLMETPQQVATKVGP